MFDMGLQNNASLIALFQVVKNSSKSLVADYGCKIKPIKPKHQPRGRAFPDMNVGLIYGTI